MQTARRCVYQDESFTKKSIVFFWDDGNCYVLQSSQDLKDKKNEGTYIRHRYL
jgi:hypothetical protein